MKLNFKKLHGDWRNTNLCGLIWFCASKYVCHVEKLSSTATTYHGCWLEDRTVILLLSNSFFHHVFDELNLFLTYCTSLQYKSANIYLILLRFRSGADCLLPLIILIGCFIIPVIYLRLGIKDDSPPQTV